MKYKEHRKDYVLSDICNGEGQYGISKSGESYANGKRRYLRITDITDDGFLKADSKVYIKVDDLEYKKFVLNKNDIVFARTGASAGRSYIYDKNEEPLIVAGFLIKFNLNNTIVNPRYMRYYTISNQYKSWVNSISTGSTRPNINRKMFSDMPISLPQISIQNQIVEILDSLENKVKNNNRIILNLEEQAQAIFKSWFIDFEPFQDGNFVDSELGEIPEGCEVISLGDLFEFCKGKKPKKIYDEDKKNYVPYLVKKYLDGESVSFANKDDGILINDMNVFMLMDGANSGNIYYGYKGILGSTFSLLQVENYYYEEYIYWYLKIKEFEIKKQNTGSAIPHANKNYIKNLVVAINEDNDFIRILDILRNIRKYVVYLKKQNKTLAQLRDILLPKLMSGELRVGQEDIENIESQI